MNNVAQLSVTTPTDLQIVMTRAFKAPRRHVWDAMTKPALLKRWMFTPPDWTWAECSMDVRAGGNFTWAWNGPNAQLALKIWGTYREVTPPSRIVHTERMQMGPGAGPCGPEGAADATEPWELLATLDLEEHAGKTTLTMTLEFPSKQARDGALASGMEHGMAAGYERLDAIFVEMGGE